MSYEKAVIVPYSWYEQNKPKAIDIYSDSPEEILKNKKLAPDVKLKLFHQQRLLNKQSTKKSISEIESEERKDYDRSSISSIVSEIEDSVKPYARDVLHLLKDHPDFSWNSSREVIIEDQPFYDSNLRDLLNYALGKLTVTRQEDIPIGGIAFLNFLDKIKIPPAWIKARARSPSPPPARPPSTTARRSSTGARPKLTRRSNIPLYTPPPPYTTPTPKRTKVISTPISKEFFTPPGSTKKIPRSKSKSYLIASSPPETRLKTKTRRLQEGREPNWIKL